MPGLYRYRDGGVPDSTRHCSLVVLFLPGHAGDYRQVRSLGNEVLRAANHEKFSAHVYALTNNEAFSGFDGDLLRQHAVQTATTLNLLCERYHVQPRLPAIVVVAHSMGGIAALEALRVLSSNGASTPPVRMDALLLLSVPLRRPVLACSASLDQIYHGLRHFWRQGAYTEQEMPAIASISGGCRDRMVPALLSTPTSALLPPNLSALSAHSSELLGVQTPADHLSILWCNQLLRVVARALVHVASLRSTHPATHPALAERVEILRGALPSITPISSSETAYDAASDATNELLHLQALPHRALLDAVIVTLACPLALEVLATARPSSPSSIAATCALSVLAVSYIAASPEAWTAHGSCGGRTASAFSCTVWCMTTRAAATATAVVLLSISGDTISISGRMVHRLAVPTRLGGMPLAAIAACIAALTHPALGLPLAMAAPSCTREGRSLMACMFVALTPNLAACVRRGPILSIWHSSDACWALGYVLACLLPIALAPSPRRVAAMVGVTTSIRSMMIAMLLACAMASTWEDELGIAISTSTVVRMASLGLVAITWPAAPNGAVGVVGVT